MGQLGTVRCQAALHALFCRRRLASCNNTGGTAYRHAQLATCCLSSCLFVHDSIGYAAAVTSLPYAQNILEHVEGNSTAGIHCLRGLALIYRLYVLQTSHLPRDIQICQHQQLSAAASLVRWLQRLLLLHQSPRHEGNCCQRCCQCLLQSQLSSGAATAAGGLPHPAERQPSINLQRLTVKAQPGVYCAAQVALSPLWYTPTCTTGCLGWRS